VTALQKSLVYGLGVILMVSTITFQATGEQAPVVSAEADEITSMIEADSDALVFPDALGNLTGITSDGNGEACPSLLHCQRTLSTGVNRRGSMFIGRISGKPMALTYIM
jgi:hypothetical protein